jgi:phosphatidylserine/phosphatidylglycerophosphate/cardiolipin synthase-like enzyme
VGGRNLGDEYFGASDEVNFVDLDFGMIGPVVRDVSASFDRYWNSPSSYPLELLHTDGIDPKALGKLRHYLANASLERVTAVMQTRCATTPPLRASHRARYRWSGRASTNS